MVSLKLSMHLHLFCRLKVTWLHNTGILSWVLFSLLQWFFNFVQFAGLPAIYHVCLYSRRTSWWLLKYSQKDHKHVAQHILITIKIQRYQMHCHLVKNKIWLLTCNNINTELTLQSNWLWLHTSWNNTMISW